MSGVSLPFGMMVIFGLMVQVCVGDVYKVGGSVGWTIVGNVNYKQWSAPKTFKVGDIICKFIFHKSPLIFCSFKVQNITTTYDLFIVSIIRNLHRLVSSSSNIYVGQIFRLLPL